MFFASLLCSSVRLPCSFFQNYSAPHTIFCDWCIRSVITLLFNCFSFQPYNHFTSWLHYTPPVLIHNTVLLYSAQSNITLNNPPYFMIPITVYTISCSNIDQEIVIIRSTFYVTELSLFLRMIILITVNPNSFNICHHVQLNMTKIPESR